MALKSILMFEPSCTSPKGVKVARKRKYERLGLFEKVIMGVE